MSLLRTATALFCLVVAISCGNDDAVVRHSSDNGEILSAGEDYTLVIFSPKAMQAAFGPGWESMDLYYRVNRAVMPDGQRAFFDGPYRPFAKGAPIAVVSGTGWDDLSVPIYSHPHRVHVSFRVDAVRGTIVRTSGPEIRSGAVLLLPDGQLDIH
jgi:hypothetical protein